MTSTPTIAALWLWIVWMNLLTYGFQTLFVRSAK